MIRQSLLLGAAGAAILATPASAQGVVSELVVEAGPIRRPANEVATPVIQLTDQELVFRRQATLGDTLAGLPGVNSDTFGGGASRPIIRGQTAPRVKILSDSSELMDASGVSPDHAVAAEPLLLDSIEVLTGPSALLYGGGAVSGAVNLVDGKTPTKAPERGVEGVAEVRAGSNAKERAGVFGMTVGGAGFAVHAEAAGRDSGDYEAGQDFGRVAGTHNRSRSVSFGGSLLGDWGYVGAAITRQTSRYGLPGHEHAYEECHPHGPTLHCGGHAEEEHDDHGEGAAAEVVPQIRLRSERVDVRGERREPFAGVERIKFRAGVTDYRHDEEERGVVGTTFRNRGHDARLELTHKPVGGWRGVVGLQGASSRFSAEGEDAFLPRTRTRTAGVFLYEELTWKAWRFELAARQDWQDIATANGPSTHHRPTSFSAAALWTVKPGYSVSLSVTRSQRAPGAQELFARGVHLATNTFEIGDATLDTESASTVDLTFRKTEGDTTFTLGIFDQRYDGYIFADTLDRFDDFRLIRYSQRDARFTGVDGDIRHRFSSVLSASIFGDYVQAELTGGENLPRIPAARLGFHVDAEWRGLTGELEYAHTFAQDKIAAFEEKTPGFDMLNATVAKAFVRDGRELQAYLRGTNLLDDLAFNHASFVRRAAPLPGRTVVAGLRVAF